MPPRAVIFDLGGVVLDSPLSFIQAFEARHGLEPGFIARIVGGYGGPDGPWQRLERGQLPLRDFCDRFDEDIRAAGGHVSSADMMREMAEVSLVRPIMLEAIRRLRGAGFKVGALTNNWVTDEVQDERLDLLRAEFHAFVESCKVGMRKPEPGIYTLACERLEIEAPQAVFLDDIGGNLKAARALGMTTLKVSDPEPALRELGEIVGLTLA